MISLSFDRCLDVVEQSAGRLVDTVERAGLDARCATCSWDGRALLAHQAMVHRWATAHVTGGDPEAVPSQTALLDTEADLPSYYREGVARLLAALAAAPADLEAMTFLKDVASPRQFWARRQTHETTIHMVDAVSAALGRVPTAADVSIDDHVAVDGIDELLCGFFTRGRSKLFGGVEYDVLVAPDDSERRWLMHVAERLTVSSSGTAPVTISGSAAEIYMALWNRGEIQVEGDADLAARWRANQRVGWS